MTDRRVPRPIATADVPWTEFSDVPRFAVRYRHLSLAALGEDYRVGVAVEELPPGKRSAPAHYHMLEEEHVFILDGALTVRLGQDTHPMQAGDYICFPAGQRAGHHLINHTDAPCRYVIIGERNPNDVIVYTDSNKVMVRPLGRHTLLDLAARRRYWDGEETGLPAGESPRYPDEPPPQPEAPPKPPISSAALAWDEFAHAPGFVDRNKHLTYQAVGKCFHVGVLIESPPPGARGAPKHYHMLEEEHALILEGEVTLLFGEERIAMKPGDYVCFPAGQRIGHSFLNSGTGPCSWLMIGERNPHEVIVQPDSGKMQVRALATHEAWYPLSPTRRYLDGEVAE